MGAALKVRRENCTTSLEFRHSFGELKAYCRNLLLTRRYLIRVTTHGTCACRQHLMRPLGIAIAEDDWFLAEYICGELAALGHAIVGRARTGEELIDVVAHERPDVVLVDIALAYGSDGLAAAKEVQERFGIPAIAATGHLSADEAETAGLLGIFEQAVYPARFAGGA